MNLDWFKLALLALAIWILVHRSKMGKAIDWPELVALAIITQVVAGIWEVA